MNLLLTPLQWLAGKGRHVLVAGLITGIFAEELALFLKDFIPEMAIGLLFLAAFRVGFRAAVGAAGDFRRALILVLVLQVVVPACLYGVFALIGWQGVLPAAMVLVGAGASVSASPHISVMTGHSPAPALRLLILGTALLPLTIVPVLWLLPQFGSADAVFAAAARLFGVIAVSATLAFLLRGLAFARITEGGIRAADGLSAILLFVIVVGLMAAVSPALRNDVPLLLAALTSAFAINFGLQLFFYFLLRGKAFAVDRVPMAITAGNRNMALFLTALPVSVTDPMLLFIGCYQIPMYLTPVLLSRLYRRSY